MYKHGQQREIQRGFKAVLGFPDATAGFSYNQSKNFALEATDSKVSRPMSFLPMLNPVQVMPKCRVDYEIGDEWDSSSESYSSYNISYELQDMRLDAERAGSSLSQPDTSIFTKLVPRRQDLTPSKYGWAWVSICGQR
jgi:hypothetical protein